MTDTNQKLKPCPFCGCGMRIESNRDWHKLYGSHANSCVFFDDEPDITVPATNDQLSLLIEDWNRRAPTGATHEQ